MTNKKGGYVIIDLASSSIVTDLQKALLTNKPVLVYNNGDASFYTLTTDGTNFTLSGANDSIGVASDGTITTNSKHLYKYEFKGDDSSNNTYFVNVMSNIYVESLDDIDSLNGFRLFGYFQDSSYNTIAFRDLDIAETKINIDNVYDGDNNISLEKSTLDGFTRTQII